MEARTPTFRGNCLSCVIALHPCVYCGPLLRIPRSISAAETVCEPLPRQEVTVELQRKRILIVDNDEDVLINLERALEEHDCETVTAWDLPEALETLAGDGFDLLLIGDHPPELNCERLLKQLNRANLGVPVVVMHSAERYPFSEAYLRYLGAMGVACKWNAEAVLEQVESCLAALPISAAVQSMAVKRTASN